MDVQQPLICWNCEKTLGYIVTLVDGDGHRLEGMRTFDSDGKPQFSLKVTYHCGECGAEKEFNGQKLT